jgi:hypothetical protein
MAQPTYQFVQAGTKNFIAEVSISPGTQISLDLLLTGVGVGNNQDAGGAWIDFKGSTAKISYVSGGRCLQGGAEGCTGPWQDNAGTFINEPDGIGTVMYVVANLGGAAPDGDGDLLIGTVTLECDAAGDASVHLSTIPDVATWTPINDADVVLGSLLIHQQVQTTTSIPIIVTTTTTTIVNDNTSTTTTLIEDITTTTIVNDDIPTTTTICYCPAVCIYDEDSEETELLRYIRDNILSKTQEGKELIKRYYQWSPVIVMLMEHDKEFKEEVKAVVDEILAMLRGEVE